MKASLSRNPPPASSSFQPQATQQRQSQHQQVASHAHQGQTPAVNPDNSETQKATEQQQSARVKETNPVERQPSFRERKLTAGLGSCERVVQIPQNIEYNREFIKSLDLDLTNAIIYKANQRGFNFGYVRNVPNESQINDVIAALHAIKNFQPSPEQSSSHVPSGPVQMQQAHIVNQSGTQTAGSLPTFGEAFNQGAENVPQQPQGPARTWATMADNLPVNQPQQNVSQPQQNVTAPAAQASSSGKSRKQGKPAQVDPRRTSGRQTKQPDRLQVSPIKGISNSPKKNSPRKQ